MRTGQKTMIAMIAMATLICLKGTFQLNVPTTICSVAILSLHCFQPELALFSFRLEALSSWHTCIMLESAILIMEHSNTTNAPGFEQDFTISPISHRNNWQPGRQSNTKCFYWAHSDCFYILTCFSLTKRMISLPQMCDCAVRRHTVRHRCHLNSLTHPSEGVCYYGHIVQVYRVANKTQVVEETGVGLPEKYTRHWSGCSRATYSD